ncbi:MAG TPA: metalloregulator ArsR/SmtB family transcription factor [Vicinamibacterales bacterium]|nr:metalloregulator ArsR/SmtB family transcription factor [Vicinamibacterales bacterium]
MVKYSTADLDVVFGALADGTRRAILARLAQGDASVMELAEPHEMSVPAVTKHLGVLASAGLISSEKSGRVRRCHLEAAPLQGAAAWMAFYQRFWDSQLDGLERFLAAVTRKDPSWTAPPPKLPSSVSPARSRRRRRSSSRRGRTRR